jgi:glycosyltransferase involved in cell wall biosynthesis
MRLLIDASNLTVGGGITHLRAFLDNLDLKDTVFTGLEVAASDKTLAKLPDPPCLIKRSHKYLNAGLPSRWWWSRKILTDWLAEEPSLLYQPGGGYSGPFHPYVTMSRNMLVFDRKEAARYRRTRVALRLRLLRVQQLQSFRNADGIIFISQYARKEVEKYTGKLATAKIIHHGVGNYFRDDVKPQKPASAYRHEKPFTFLYVSVLDRYKHQALLLNAFRQLHENGLPVRLELVGAMSEYMPEGFSADLDRALEAKYAVWHGKIDHKRMVNLYNNAEAALFASTCENMPNVLIEAMSSGLPVLCSKYPPMPEFLRDGGHYFDPESLDNTVVAITSFFENPERRFELATLSHRYAQEFSWRKCVTETTCFLNEIANKK